MDTQDKGRERKTVDRGSSMDTSGENKQHIIDYILGAQDRYQQKGKPKKERGSNAIFVCPECSECFSIGESREHHYGQWNGLSSGKPDRICVVCSL